jgi:hypothetical protein
MLAGRCRQKKAEPVLKGEVECEEVHVVAGHKGRPDKIKGRAAGGSRARPGEVGGRLF